MQVVDYKKRAFVAMCLTRLGLFLLVVDIIVSTLWMVPTHKSPNLVVCLMALLPLALLLPWIIKKNTRAHIWLCFVLLGYFLNAVLHAFIAQYGWLPLLEITILIGLFISSMLFARWQHRAVNA